MKAPPDQGQRPHLLDTLGGTKVPTPERKPRPRLLDSAVICESPKLPEGIPLPTRESFGKRFFRLLIRVVVLSLIISGVAHWALRRNGSDEVTAIRKIVAVGTRMLSDAGHPPKTPSSIVVQLNSDMIQVTAIALGHPRLAVINGKQVTEGDTITIHTPSRFVAVTLKVMDISDQQVTLSDGTQILTAHLLKAGK